MAKDASKKDPIEKARRRLAKVQLELSVAEEEHAQARVRGKQEIEQARLRAAKWLTKTGKRMDRRAASVAKAEDRLAMMTDASQESSSEPAAAPAAVNSAPRSDLRPRERQALEALSAGYGVDGATATQWQAAARMSEATFLRARKELTERGLVVRNGGARRGAHYQVPEPNSE